MCHVTEVKELSTDQMPHSIRPGGALEYQADKPREQTITLAATFTAEPIRAALEFWTEKLGIPAQLRFAPYNQVFQYLLNLDASHVDSQASTQVILLRLEDWEGRQDRALNERIQGVERTAHEFAAVVSAAAQRTSASYLVCFCPPSRASVDRFGGEDTLQNIERSLAIQLEQCRQVQVITSSSLVELYPVAEYEDEYASQIAHIPYTPAFFAALATMIARRIYSACDTPRKVIAIDCDHTLWDGVCAEDGPTGVLVDSAHCILQNFLVEQYNAGMLLCLVSKNTEEDVAAVFTNNSGMRLRLEHVISTRINWQSKPTNLKELANELNLGLDTFVFIDDNPVECAEVRAACPEVLVIQLPASPERIRVFIRHIWALDHQKLTQEDTRRNTLYRQERARDEARENATSFEDFLSRLDLKIAIRGAAPQDWPRLAQLTERTNQFNFTGIRRSVREIAQLIETGAICLSVEVADRFGDYGLVGFMAAIKRGRALSVDTFVLSCRALGRGVEDRMLARLGMLALENGLEQVHIPFTATPRNQPARDFLERQAALERNDDGESGSYCFLAAGVSRTTLMNGGIPERTRSNAMSMLPVNRAPQSTRTADILIEIADRMATVEEIVDAIESHKKSRPGPLDSYRSPRTAVEERLSNIWSILLHVESPGIDDDFFSLGGNSMVAAQVVAQIRNTFGIELSLHALSEAPTIADLAGRVKSGVATNHLKTPSRGT